MRVAVFDCECLATQMMKEEVSMPMSTASARRTDEVGELARCTDRAESLGLAVVEAQEQVALVK